jgi:hypothetical protein
MHAIGVREDVTLVEFKRTCPVEQEPARGQETQPPEAGGSEEDLLECLNRKPSFFVNGKPRSIKSPNF